MIVLTRLDAGAMMTEIGLAQQRLLDDDASSTGQRLPSTATPYSSEISQPGSFPTVQTYQYQQVGDLTNDGFTYTRPLHNGLYEATQLVAPGLAQAYDYSTPAASTNVDSPLGGPEQIATYPMSMRSLEGTHAHASPKTAQRTRSLQSGPYSPHDTEPLSSVVSSRLHRSKSDNARSGLMSPQHSQADTHDELSLPAVSVEVSTVKNARGRPKNESVPEDDEDDELAVSQAPEFEQTKTSEKRRPGRPPKAAEVVAPPDAAAGTETVEADTDATNGNTNASGLTAVSEKPTVKEPKKKKIKRSKTASAVMRKTRESDIDDDVIWVDSRPIQIEEDVKEKNNTDSTLTDPNPFKDPQTAPTPSTEDKNQPLHSEEQPAPKKRGRKRKKTTEQLAAEAEQEAKENQPTAETPVPDAPVVEDTSEAIRNLQNEDIEPTKPADPSPQPDSATHHESPSEPLPQTPQRNQDSEKPTDKSSRKGPGQHSPISSTSKVPYRVGLSKRARIAPLLKIVRK